MAKCNQFTSLPFKGLTTKVAFHGIGGDDSTQQAQAYSLLCEAAKDSWLSPPSECWQSAVMRKDVRVEQFMDSDPYHHKNSVDCFFVQLYTLPKILCKFTHKFLSNIADRLTSRVQPTHMLWPQKLQQKVSQLFGVVVFRCEERGHGPVVHDTPFLWSFHFREASLRYSSNPRHWLNLSSTPSNKWIMGPTWWHVG